MKWIILFGILRHDVLLINLVLINQLHIYPVAFHETEHIYTEYTALDLYSKKQEKNSVQLLTWFPRQQNIVLKMDWLIHNSAFICTTLTKQTRKHQFDKRPFVDMLLISPEN